MKIKVERENQSRKEKRGFDGCVILFLGLVLAIVIISALLWLVYSPNVIIFNGNGSTYSYHRQLFDYFKGCETLHKFSVLINFITCPLLLLCLIDKECRNKMMETVHKFLKFCYTHIRRNEKVLMTNLDIHFEENENTNNKPKKKISTEMRKRERNHTFNLKGEGPKDDDLLDSINHKFHNDEDKDTEDFMKGMDILRKRREDDEKIRKDLLNDFLNTYEEGL